MRTRNRSLVLSLLTLTAFLLPTACSSGPSANDLYAEMREATKTATSVRIAGNLVEGGEAMTIDLRGSLDGSNQRAEVIDGEEKATILTVDGTDYVQGNATYWGDQEMAADVGDTYVALPGADSAAETLNPGLLLDEFLRADLDGNPITSTVESSERDGQPAYMITDRFAAEGEVEIWVSADGEAHLLEVNGVLDGQPMKLTFSEWNAVEPITAPPAEQVFTY